MRWQAQLGGHDFDLSDLPWYFPAGRDPEVEKDADGYWLASSTFNDLPEAVEVDAAARRIVRLINGAAKAVDRKFQPVELTGRYRDERRSHVVITGLTAHARSKVGRVTLDGGMASPQPAGPADFLRLARHNADVADALRVLASPEIDSPDLGWLMLYKLLEIVRHDVGGTKPIVDKGWATSNQMKAFKTSANYPGVSGGAARHARDDGRLPKRTMTLDEGRGLMRTVVQQWLTWRSEET